MSAERQRGLAVPARRDPALALERRRFGYRRLGIMLAREGLVVNHKKLLRLYREENLRVRRRRGRKRAMGTRAPMTLPAPPSERTEVVRRLACGRPVLNGGSR